MPDHTYTDKMKHAPPAYDELLASHERLLMALEAIANIGGNLPDERLENATGPNDARLRGGMVVGARDIARYAIQQAKSLQGGK